MKECFDCGSKNIVDLGNGYKILNNFFGYFNSQENHVFKCKDCGMILMDKKCRKWFQSQIDEKIQDFLLENHNPINHASEYIEESHLVQLVKIFDKHFIMKLNFDGKILYWKQSVDKYLSTGDGRIKIF